jgi:hypothetical protein
MPKQRRSTRSAPAAPNQHRRHDPARSSGRTIPVVVSRSPPSPAPWSPWSASPQTKRAQLCTQVEPQRLPHRWGCGRGKRSSAVEGLGRVHCHSPAGPGTSRFAVIHARRARRRCPVPSKLRTRSSPPHDALSRRRSGTFASASVLDSRGHTRRIERPIAPSDLSPVRVLDSSAHSPFRSADVHNSLSRLARPIDV